MKMFIANIAAFLCAASVFCGTVTNSFENIDVLSDEENLYEDFLQPDDLLIGDLESEDFLNSSNIISDVSSDDDPSSTVSSNESSSNASSNASSSVSSSVSSSNSSNLSSNQSSLNQSSSSSLQSSSNASSKPTSSNNVTSSSSQESSKPPSSQAPSSSNISSDSSEYDELIYILAGAVQREIVGTNTQPQEKYYEAYKAQAVASHTYMEYHKKRNGYYPSMSFAEPKQKTIELVKSVIDELIYYDGELINASYHAASGGYTQSAKYVWGGTVPYLLAVESKYDEYEKTAIISVSTVQSKLENYGITVSGDASSWFDMSSITYTDGEFVDYIEICGTKVKGRTLRESILGASTLMSAKIENIYVSNGNFYFDTKGYGHGVGLSQRGALGYSANEGKSYKWILTHYYSGVTIK